VVSLLYILELIPNVRRAQWYLLYHDALPSVFVMRGPIAISCLGFRSLVRWTTATARGLVGGHFRIYGVHESIPHLLRSVCLYTVLATLATLGQYDALSEWRHNG
jgi:hypothetical protein